MTICTHIRLQRCEGGYWGILTAAGDTTGVFMGDIGARPRSFWRFYARREGYRLIEER